MVRIKHLKDGSDILSMGLEGRMVAEDCSEGEEIDGLICCNEWHGICGGRGECDLKEGGDNCIGQFMEIDIHLVTEVGARSPLRRLGSSGLRAPRFSHDFAFLGGL